MSLEQPWFCLLPRQAANTIIPLRGARHREPDLFYMSALQCPAPAPAARGAPAATSGTADFQCTEELSTSQHDKERSQISPQGRGSRERRARRHTVINRMGTRYTGDIKSLICERSDGKKQRERCRWPELHLQAPNVRNCSQDCLGFPTCSNHPAALPVPQLRFFPSAHP